MSADKQSGFPEDAPGTVIVQGRADGFVQHVTAGGHSLTSDEPTASGGTNLGPTPYDLLLAALGTCTSMTLAMYARRKQWPLGEVTVRLTHARVHAQDCEDCESAEGYLHQIDREIAVTGDLSDEQRKRLGEIADMCPVHRTLTSEIRISTTMARA